MSRDGKLGLVVGMGLVLTIGIVFYRKDAAPTNGPNGTPAASSVGKPPPAPVEPGTLAPAPEPPPLPAD